MNYVYYQHMLVMNKALTLKYIAAKNCTYLSIIMGALGCVCVLIVLAVMPAAAQLSCNNVPDFNGSF